MASEKIDGFTLEQRHGKARVRLGRVWRSQSGRHVFVEWTVSISLLSNCLAAYVRDDNSDIVATDSMKNTVIFLLHFFLQSSVWLMITQQNLMFLFFFLFLFFMLLIYLVLRKLKRRLLLDRFFFF